jgi:subtilisin family serine protease/methionine-rich copper-binding protein CopC
VREAVKAVFEQLELRRLLNGAVNIPDPTPIQVTQPHDDEGLGVIIIDWNGQKVEAVEGEYILKLDNVKGKKSDQLKDVKTKVEKLRKDVSVRKHLNHDGTVLLRGPKDEDFEDLKKSLKNAPGFSYIEPNFVVHGSSTFPNDASFTNLYGLHNTGQLGGKVDADIDAPEAWDIARGDGKVVVGVIDTGIDYNHPDLSSNMWRNPGEVAGNNLDDDANGYIDDVYGWDFVGAGDNNPIDDHYHGTHVAGTIGGVGNNGSGVVGVNWNVKLMALKFLSASGGGTTADAIEAVSYATMMHNLWVATGGAKGANIRLTSNSWGGGGFSQALMDAIAAAGTSSGGGMLFVAAAGNEGTNNDSLPHYPSSYNLPNIVAVAATDRNDGLASFSCWGPTSVDIGAPGVDTYSTSPGSSYRSLSGTSMATPHVSGVAALAWSVAPNATYQQIRDAMYAGADPIPSLAGKTVTGKRLNAFGTLQQLGLSVSGSTPAADSIVVTAPVDFVIHFSNPYASASVQASDLLVNGAAADSVIYTDADTLTFHYNTSPVTAQGLQTMAMAAGSVLRQSDGNALSAWSSTFRFDSAAMGVIATNPANNALVSLPIAGIELTFNEPYSPSSISIADLTLSQGTVTGFTLVDADTVRYLVSGMIGETTITYSLATGAVTDQFGNPALPYSGSFATDIGTVPYPTPLEGKTPRGSLIYDPVASGNIGTAADTDSFTISLDAGQTASLIVDPVVGLRPMVELLGPGGAILGSASAGTSGQDVLLNSVAASAAGMYTIRVSSVGGTTGGYTVRLIVNAAVEAEEYSGPTNDTLGTAQNLGPSVISLGAGGATRAAVTGKLPSTSGTVTVASENFEFGTLSPAWSTYIAPAGGRIQVTGAHGTGGGAFALLMDNATDDGAYRLNEAIWTVDLSGLTAATLSFAHTAIGDENEPMPPGDYTGHVNGDGVSISDDGITWRAIWNADGTSWTTPHNFNLAALASAAGMTLGANFKIKFQQYDNFALTVDGRGWDNIAITKPAAAANPNDYYSFNLAAGESATIVLAHQSGASGETIALLDSTGAVIATGLAGSTGAISDFVAPSAGTYYVRVSGSDAAEYNLLVTRNAAFDLGGNNTRANAQPAGPSGIVLGSIQAQTGAGRLYAYDASAKLIREINPQTGAIIRSFASPAADTGDPDFGMATTGNSLLVGGSGSAAIYELNLDTGAIIRTIPNPGINVSGMAFLNNEIYVLTDYIAGQITVFSYNTGAVARQITAPAVNEGLGASATALYGTNGSVLYQINPLTGATTQLGTLPTTNFSEGVGVIGNELYISEFNQIGVYDINTRARLRSLIGLNDLDAIGADGGGAAGGGEDYYRITVNAGQTVVLQTLTPGDGPYEPVNNLDARLRLLDSAGNVIASDDNSAGDGRNARITHTVLTSGTYYVQVSSAAAPTSVAASGDYVLSITGASATPASFTVASTNPATGSGLLAPPTQMTVDFSNSVLLTSLQASDLIFDGTPLSVMTVVDSNTATFNLPAGMAQGPHTFAFAAGSVTDLQGNALQAFNGSFSLDNNPPRVIASSVQQGDVLSPGNLTYTATFSKPMLVSNLDSSDLTLRGNLRALNYTAATLAYSADGRTLTVTYTNLPEDSYTFTLLSGLGRFEGSTGLDLDGEATWPIPPNQSGNGIEGGNFVATFSTDVATSAYPGPLVALAPLGSLVYDPAVSGVIGAAGDADTFTISLDAGQSLSVFADPSAGLQPTITVRDPSGAIIGTASATAANLDALLQTVAINTAGTYQITVAGVGSSTGMYTLQAVLNAAVEAESHNGATNNTLPTAQNIDSSFIDLLAGAQRGAVIGTAISEDDYYSFTLAAGQSSTIVLSATASGALELYNASGVLLTRGEGAVQAIRDFRAPATGLYYAKVRGTDYTLLVTRDASFDLEPNNTPAQAAPLAPSGVGFGYIERTISGVEPDNYAVGTVLTNIVPGVTLSAQGSTSAVTSQTTTYRSTGTRVFAYGTNTAWASSSVMFRADFATATSSVSIDIVPNDSSDPGLLRAYNAAGVLLQEVTCPATPLGTFTTLTITRPTPDIAYITAAGVGGDNVNLDNLVVGGVGGGNDSYTISVNAGDNLVIRTLTPADGSGAFINLLDPLVELYNPSGTKVAFNDNGGADGRNALLNYTALVAGTYTVKILPGGSGTTNGEYILGVSGATGSTTPPFVVSSTSIPNGTTFTTPPAQITVDFNDTFLISSLQASDLTVDGIAATGFSIVDFNTVAFTLPALGNGAHTVAVAGGSIVDLQQTGVSPFTSSFTLDFNPPKVVASSIQENDVRATGALTYTVSFNKSMLKTNLDASDVTLLGALKNISYVPASLSFDAAGTTLTVTYTSLPEDIYTLTLLSGSGRFQDTTNLDLDGEPVWPIPPNTSGNGVAGGNFVLHFSVDAPTGAFPTPFTPRTPAGSLIYDSSVSGVIGNAADTDSFTVALDAGQIITLVADAGATLSHGLELRGPGNVLIASATSAGVGKDAVLQTAPVAVAGVYTVIISGVAGSTGTYSIAATLNAAVEAENNDGPANNTRPAAQNVAGSFLTLNGTGTRGGVVGKLDGIGGGDFFAFNASAGDKLFLGFETTASPAAIVVNLQDAAGNVLATANAGPTNVDKVISGFTAPAGGTYYIFVGGSSAAGDYTLTLNRNADFDLESNDTNANAQNLLTHTVLGHGGSGSSSGVAGTIESFDDGNLTEYTFLSVNNASVTPAAAHDGAFGLQLTNSGEWMYRADPAVQFGRGNVISYWVRTSIVPGGRLYCGFGASATGTLSMVMAPNTNALLIQNNSGYNFVDIGSSPQTWQANKFYRMEVTWQTTGAIIGKLYDSDGTTLLNTVNATDTTITSGGLAFRGFGATYHVDSVSTNTPTTTGTVDRYKLTVQAGETIKLLTATPSDGPSQFVNTFNPRIRVLDSAGNVVASDDNSAPDGRNAKLTHLFAAGGTYYIEISSTAAAATSGEYVLSVNRTPAANDDTASTLEDSAVTVNVLANDADPDGDTLTVDSATQGAHGAVVINPDGTITYTPVADYFGPDSFTYTVRDGSGETDTATVSIDVKPVNDVPSFTAGANQIVDEDAGAQTISNWATNISAGSNESAQAVDFIVSNDNNALFAQQPTISADGTLSFTPAANASGAATVTVIIHDDGGTDSGGTDTSVAQTFEITVTAVADAPTLTVNPATGDEGSVIPLDIAVLLVDTDGSETATIEISGLPAGATLSAGSEDSGVWTLTPAELSGLTIQNLLDNGSYDLTVTAVATEASNGDQASTTATLALTVNNVNPVVDPLVAPASIVRGQAVVISGSFTDAGALDTHEVSWDFGDGSTIAFHPSTDAGALAPAKTYTTAGTYIVTFTVRDDDGGVTSMQKTVTVKPWDVQADPFNPGTTMLVIGGTPGDDDIHIIENSKGYRVDFKGLPSVYFNGITRFVIYGQAGNDGIGFARSITLPVEIYGGAGNDTLSDAGGDDILVGGDGNDVINAAQGRDILIGGSGADNLDGGPDDDLLVPTATAHDANRQALVAIQQEWRRTDTYAHRVANILGTGGGGANGSFQFNTATVIDDNVSDSMQGSSGTNWFFSRRTGGNADVISGGVHGEELITDLL